MSDGINSWVGFGRLADDCEVKELGTSTLVTFRLACEESYKVGNEWKKKVEYVPCSWWGTRAKGAAQYLTKGKPCAVQGAFQTRTFDDKNGKKQYRSEIRVTNVSFASQGGRQAEEPDHSPPTQDDIPF